MKPFLFAFLITCFSVLPYNNATAFADSSTTNTYAVAETDSVMFFKDANQNTFLFYLPKSYYLLILDEGENFLHVECYGDNSNTPRIDGYVLKDSVKLVNDNVVAPYLDLTIITLKNCNLYENVEFSSITQHLFENRALNFYGHAFDKTGGFVYFVHYNGRFGYVEESCVNGFTIPLHPNFVENETFNNVDTQTSTNTTTVKTLNITIIIALCLALLFILSTIIKPKKQKPNFD